MMNQRNYQGAVDSLEQSYAQNPNDKNTALLLAEAHIGLSGTDLFSTLSKISSAQENPPLELVVKVHCTNESWNSFDDKNIACILERFLESGPSGEDPNVERAKAIIRGTFADIHNATSDINFFGAYVELTSIFSHLRYMASYSTEKTYLNLKGSEALQDQVFVDGVHNFKAVFEGAKQSFARAKYSYKKIGTYTRSIDGKPLLVFQKHELTFDENFDLERMVQFLLTVMHDDAGQLDEHLNDRFSGLLQRMVPHLLHYLHELDIGSFNGANEKHLLTMFKFESLLDKALAAAPNDHSLGGQDGGPMQLSLWIAHPPELIRRMFEAFSESWNQENPRYLRQYIQDTQETWLLLDGLSTRWKKLSENLSQAQLKALLSYVEQKRAADITFLALPEKGRDLREWKDATLKSADNIVKLILAGAIPNFEAFSASDAQELQSLWQDSRAWIDANF